MMRVQLYLATTVVIRTTNIAIATTLGVRKGEEAIAEATEDRILVNTVCTTRPEVTRIMEDGREFPMQI